MPRPTGLPLGYHRLELEAAGIIARLNLIVAPPPRDLPKELAPNVPQLGSDLPALRFAQLAQLGYRRLQRSGNARRCCRVVRRPLTLGINPLHALFAAEPLHCSPYSPSSRIWLDYLYIDVTAVPGFAEDETAPRAD